MTNSTTLFRVARDYAISIAAWLTMSLLVSWQAIEETRREHLSISHHDLFLLFGVRYLTVALLTPPIFYCAERWPLKARNAVLRVASYAVGYVPFSMAFAFLRWCILPPWMEGTGTWGPRTLPALEQLTYQTFADVLLIYVGVVIAAHAYAYYVRSQRQEIERLELFQALAQSELQALKFQLHPHFLFNTLQGISTLIDTDQRSAQGMIVKLSRLLRIALKHGSADLVPLSDEVEFAESYLDLQKMRLGKRLEIYWKIAPETRSALVPQLILQPLIENAIVHGIACSREGGWIEIRSQAGEMLMIEIRNSIGGNGEKGLGLGLQNTAARLKYLYSDEATFAMDIRPEGLATATLRMPSFVSTQANENTAVSMIEA